MGIRRLVIVAAGVLVVSLVLHLPANVAIGWAGLDEHIAMNGVSGTVWTGGAGAASVDRMHLGQLRWRFRPFALVLGRIDYQVEISGPTLRFSGALGPTAGGGVRVSGANAIVRLAALGEVIPAVENYSLDGTLDLNIDRLRLAPMEAARIEANPSGLWPRSAAGSVRIASLQIPRLGSGSLGDYQVEVRDESGSDDLLIDFRDLGGPLELSGNLRLHPDSTFEQECQAQARAGAPAMLIQLALI